MGANQVKNPKSIKQLDLLFGHKRITREKGPSKMARMMSQVTVPSCNLIYMVRNETPLIFQVHLPKKSQRGFRRLINLHSILLTWEQKIQATGLLRATATINCLLLNSVTKLKGWSRKEQSWCLLWNKQHLMVKRCSKKPLLTARISQVTSFYNPKMI